MPGSPLPQKAGCTCDASGIVLYGLTKHLQRSFAAARSRRRTTRISGHPLARSGVASGTIRLRQVDHTAHPRRSRDAERRQRPDPWQVARHFARQS